MFLSPSRARTTVHGRELSGGRRRRYGLITDLGKLLQQPALPIADISRHGDLDPRVGVSSLPVLQGRHALPGEAQLLPGLNSLRNQELAARAAERFYRNLPAQRSDRVGHGDIEKQVLPVALKLRMGQHVKLHV